MRRTTAAILASSMLSLLVVPALARAQTTTPVSTTAEPEGTGATVEEPDATRLDVERLPPEAIRITRDLYAHGFFIEASVGGRGFIGGIGDVSSPGPFAAIGFGYELFDWLFVRAIADLSIHETAAPAPPDTTVFELFSALGAVKLQINPTAEFALWLEGQAGMIIATNDVLVLYGLQDATSVGFAWGADLGVDAHFHSRHYSIGLHGGVRGAPSLDGFDGEMAIGVQGAAYLRYVF
ncbi:hypothetical protein [Sandaracinus amylolyticus]|uniref:hypothetical protein n=1 Tax=Sandaracinus amylolyticus TaxID=927083 RepID=UPI001F2C63E2|nr:hypothetical protein [Sandaracinus amylolyticus]